MGNTWVIFIIAKRKRLQTTANWFVLSLAVADLSFTCGWFPALMVCEELVESCKYRFIHTNLSSFFIRASTFALIAMITERYIAIVHSLKYIRFFTTTRTTVVIIATSWGIPTTCFMFTLILKISNSELPAQVNHIISVIYLLLFEIAPTILLVAAHFRILLIARKISLETKALLSQVRFNMEANSVTIRNIPKMGLKASTVRLVTALIVMFLACYGIDIHSIICKLFEACVVSVGETVAGSLLLLANSALNPLVYAFLKEDIKRETKILLCRRRRIKRTRRVFQVHRE